MENNDAERAAFHKLIKDLYAVYKPGTEPERPVVRMYFEALKQYTLEEVFEGAGRHMVDPDQGGFLPKPADIVRHIAGNTTTQGEQAWTKVANAIGQVGPWQSVTFDDPIIHQCINDMGGWVSMCSVSEEEFPFKHIEFVKRYRGYINRAPAIALIPGRLGGIAAGQNQLAGHQYEEQPLLIGNPQKAQALLEHGGKGKPALVHRADGIALGVAHRLLEGHGGGGERE